MTRMLSDDERRRFEEIVRGIEGDGAEGPGVVRCPAPGPTRAAALLSAVGLLVVGATGVVTGIAVSDPVVLVLVGILPLLGALSVVAKGG